MRCQVAVRPALPPLTVDAFPDAALPHVNLSAALPPEDWERLSRNACRRASYRCGRLAHPRLHACMRPRLNLYLW
jgi:hypothetical protein